MITGDVVPLAHEAVISRLASLPQTDFGQKVIVFQYSGGVCRLVMRLSQKWHSHDHVCAGCPDECLAQVKPEGIMTAEDLVYGQPVVEQQCLCLAELLVGGKLPRPFVDGLRRAGAPGWNARAPLPLVR